MIADEVILERVEYGLQAVITDRGMPGVSAEVMIDRVVELMAREVTAIVTVTGETLQEVRYPRDWWQAVKNRFAPTWALRRWPVVEVVVNVRVLYPKVSMPLEEHIWRFDRT